MSAARGLTADYILSTMAEWEVFPQEAAAVATKAVELGLARRLLSYEQAYQQAAKIIKQSRDLTQLMLEAGFINEP